MSERYKTILLFGAPGAGKGTQGAMLNQIPGFHHMSTGDMFRSLDRESDIGREIVRYMHAGELVPDELTVRLWRANVAARTTLGMFVPRAELLVLDGIPRSEEQARLISESVEVVALVHLNTSRVVEMVERLKRRALSQGREDDAKEEVIRRRFEVYERETRPVIGCYESGLVRDVDPIGTQAEVLGRVLSVVAPIARDVLGEG